MASMTYQADDLEYLVDTGIFIECPSCGDDCILDRAIDSGCLHCDQEPWDVHIEVGDD